VNFTIMISIFLVAGYFSVVAPHVSGVSFLEPVSVSKDELESRLLSELAQALSPRSTEKPRIEDLQAKLQPMYETVPQEHDGTLSHAVVRYILHRFFAKHHGWFIRGLEPRGDAHNSTRNAQEMQEWIPSYMQAFLEQIMDKKGLSLRDISIFAATIEDFIHKEESEWVKRVYDVLAYRTDLSLTSEQVGKVLETFWMLYNFNGNISSRAPGEVDQLRRFFVEKLERNCVLAFRTAGSTSRARSEPQKGLEGGNPCCEGSWRALQ
jgi:hypothetical protein